MRKPQLLRFRERRWPAKLSPQARGERGGPTELGNYCFGLLVCAGLLVSSPAFGNPAGLETGRDIFFKHCKACHGDKGDGKTFAANVLNPPPKNFTSEKSRRELTEERMLRSVAEGRKGTAMMPWKSRLTSNEIRAVVGYIRKKLMNLEPQINRDRQ